MNNSTLRNYFKEYWLRLAAAAIIIIVLAGSWATLTTKPRLWTDEAKSMELAKSFLNFGKLNIQIAPGEFTDFPELLQSTGYPITVPLAGFFKIFGYGFTQARIYMLLWMVIALAAVFMVGRGFWGERLSLLSVGLIATFASFHDSGRTVVGEIPGFFFLLLGIYSWFNRRSYFWSGIWWGLAIVSKPSVFTWILPAILIVCVLEKINFLKKIVWAGTGMLPAAAGWVWLVLDQPFLSGTWAGIVNFYKNPYEASSLAENIRNNLLNVPFSTTLIYFGILFILFLWTRTKEENFNLRSLYNFVIIYSFFAFIYYLRSPGWLRYILISELLILFVLPPIVSLASARWAVWAAKFKFNWNQQKLSAGLVAALIALQLIHFLTSAQIFYSDAEIEVSRLLNKEFSHNDIGLINALSLSALVTAGRRFQSVKMTGIPVFGESPLLNEHLPDVIVLSSGEELSEKENINLNKYYLPHSTLRGYAIFILN